MSEEVDRLERDRLAELPTSNSNFIVQMPTLEVTVRGRKIKLASGFFGLNDAPAQMWWVFCMLQLNNPEIDQLLCEMKIIVTDSNNQTIFDWQKGGWIQ